MYLALNRIQATGKGKRGPTVSQLGSDMAVTSDHFYPGDLGMAIFDGHRSSRHITERIKDQLYARPSGSQIHRPLIELSFERAGGSSTPASDGLEMLSLATLEQRASEMVRRL